MQRGKYADGYSLLDMHHFGYTVGFAASNAERVSSLLVRRACAVGAPPSARPVDCALRAASCRRRPPPFQPPWLASRVIATPRKGRPASSRRADAALSSSTRVRGDRCSRCPLVATRCAARLRRPRCVRCRCALRARGCASRVAVTPHSAHESTVPGSSGARNRPHFVCRSTPGPVSRFMSAPQSPRKYTGCPPTATFPCRKTPEVCALFSLGCHK